MELFFDAYQYYLENQGFFWEAMGRHLALSLSALMISVLIGVPLGIWISRQARAAARAGKKAARPAASANPERCSLSGVITSSIARPRPG